MFSRMRKRSNSILAFKGGKRRLRRANTQNPFTSMALSYNIYPDAKKRKRGKDKKEYTL